jgi:hypothetical protein
MLKIIAPHDDEVTLNGGLSVFDPQNTNWLFADARGKSQRNFELLNL